jgi:hypothetical protein
MNTMQSVKLDIRKDSKTMISLNFNLRNPWSNTFKNLWFRFYTTPIKNKFIEIEAYRDSSIISFVFAWTIRQSHSGVDLELGLLGYCLRFNFYDNRHWDTNAGHWESDRV